MITPIGIKSNSWLLDNFNFSDILSFLSWFDYFKNSSLSSSLSTLNNNLASNYIVRRHATVTHAGVEIPAGGYVDVTIDLSNYGFLTVPKYNLAAIIYFTVQIVSVSPTSIVIRLINGDTVTRTGSAYFNLYELKQL